MIGGVGLGIGFAQGLDKVNEGMQRRLQLQQQAESQEMARQQFTMNMGNAQMQNQILAQKLDQMEKQRAMDVSFRSFDAFENSGDAKYLNLGLKDSPVLKSMVDKMGYVGFSSVKDYSPEKLAQMGYKEDEYVRPVVVTKSDGTQQINDMFGFYGMSGYLDRAHENIINDFERKVTAYQAKQLEQTTEITDIEKDNYIEYVNKAISEGTTPLSFKEFGKQPKGGSSVSGIKTKTEATMALAELNTKEQTGQELTPLEKEQKTQLDRFLTTDSEMNKSIISKGLEVTQKYADGLDSAEITVDDIKAIEASESLTKSTGDKATVKELTDNYTTLKQGYKLVSKVNSLKPEDLEKGLVDEGILAVKKLLSDDEFTKLSSEDKTKALDTVKFNTRLGSYLADYIRSISGTAASEAEFQRLKTVLTGGSFNNTQTLQSAIQEFVKLEDEKFNSNLDSKYLLAKGSVLRMKYNYNKELKGSLDTSVVAGEPNEKPRPTKEQIIQELKRRGVLQ